MDDTYCAIIPTHNHVQALSGILNRLSNLDLPVVVIDDGSKPDKGRDISEICGQFQDVEYLRHSFNGGKGFAVLCGLARAAERGFTHAVQIDADGQHDLDGLPSLLATSRDDPDALVAGDPMFDETAPVGRRVGRKFTAFWVAVNANSLRMPDAMCGFRIYPVQPTLNVVGKQKVRGRWMDFDIEVLVKAHWSRIPIVASPVRVVYPDDNSSNFRMLGDNVLLTLMQCRLFVGMLARWPVRLLASDDKGEGRLHWASLRERGTYTGLYLVALVYKILGRRISLVLLTPIVGFFFLTGTTARRASADFLQRAWSSGYLPAPPGIGTSFRHYMNFAGSAVDKFEAWTGRSSPDDVTGIMEGPFREAELAGGAFILTAHLGNPEVLRAIAGVSGRWRVNVLVHTVHAEMFNRLVERFSGQSTVRMTQVTSVGPETAIQLASAIERGEWVVMAADRVPVTRDGRTVKVPFMGAIAEFPQGPFILASILKCPTHVMFCTKVGERYQVHFEAFADPVRLPRGRREQAIREYAVRFAAMLEIQVAKTPLQWFNFYPFWNNEDVEDSPDTEPDRPEDASP
ncbi:glycosyltransferase family 2 protein [Minwuia sp.]|uniref:glycosyltransferase family 2 protein n=1 Tax=Minwuia sp. TaxID=2493630 RepID=UPI003A8FF37C